jgi:hypothetical protein
MRAGRILLFIMGLVLLILVVILFGLDVAAKWTVPLIGLFILLSAVSFFAGRHYR